MGCNYKYPKARCFLVSNWCCVGYEKLVCPEVSISAPQGTTKCHKTRRIEYSGTGRRQRTWFSVRTSVGRPNSWHLSFWYRASYAKSIPRCRGIVYWQSSENQRIRCQVQCGCSVRFSFQSTQITLIVDKIQNQPGFYILVYQQSSKLYQMMKRILSCVIGIMISVLLSAQIKPITGTLLNIVWHDPFFLWAWTSIFEMKIRKNNTTNFS